MFLFVRRIVQNSFSPTVYSSIEDFLSRFTLREPSGSLQIDDSLPIQMKWINRHASTTFVVFSAAITRRAATEVPVFTGWRTTKHLPTNVLMVSDPSLILDTGLNLGWYVGSEWQPDFVNKLTRILGLFGQSSRLVLFGASGGGYAALTQAWRLPGSTALVSNPQTDITKFSYYTEFRQRAWTSHEVPPIPLEVNSRYSQPIESRVVYIQNVNDSDHMKNHFEPFMTVLHPSNQVLALTPDLGGGHIGPAPDSFKEIFTTVCEQTNFEELSSAMAMLQIYSTRTAPNVPEDDSTFTAQNKHWDLLKGLQKAYQYFLR